MSSDVVISCAGLGKAYRLYRRPADRLKELLFGKRGYGEEFWAVQGVDLELRRGEAMAIIGRNGSGKSTLLQVLCRTLRPSRGTLAVEGRVAALLELGAGFNPDFTGRENVYLSASVLGLSREDIRDRFDAIAGFAGIGDFIDQPVRHYSSGMYARLAFSVCAHVDADILVIDEILAVGDAAFQQKCMRFLRDFRQRGTLLFVSHDTGAVLGLCERALWLERGEVRAIGPSKEVCHRYLTALARAASDQEGFRIGGRRHQSDAVAPLVAADRACESDVGDAVDVFNFDPDAPWQGQGGAIVEDIGIFASDGSFLTWAEGGDEIEVLITCCAERSIARPVVAFVVRNRLGIALFTDNTCGTELHGVAEGQRFKATFRFYLPHLPTGDYAIEGSLFDAASAGSVPLTHLQDSCFLHVTSNPIFEAAANMTMRAIRFDIDGVVQPTIAAQTLDRAFDVA